MSESEESVVHTPGPWGYHFTEVNPYHAYIHDKDKECIALMDSRGGLSSTDEIKANARLLAAAPELIRSLKAIVNHQDMIGVGMSKLSTTRHIAAKAILDATGEVV